MKLLILIVFTLFSTTLSYAQLSVYDGVLKYWNKRDKSDSIAANVFEFHRQVAKTIKSENRGNKNKQTLKNASKYNDYILFSTLGRMVDKVTKEDLTTLPSLSLNDTLINGVLNKNGFIIDSYYTLYAMKNGMSWTDAKTGMIFNTLRAGHLTDLDYKKITDIFLSNNDKLKERYVQNVSHIFRFSGMTYKLMELYPIVEKYAPECKAKEKVMAQYIDYAHLLPGKPAPEFALKNIDGKEFKLSDYRGKYVIIDVWATW